MGVDEQAGRHRASRGNAAASREGCRIEHQDEVRAGEEIRIDVQRKNGAGMGS